MIKKICVADFVGDPTLLEAAREIAFAALFSGKRFVLTEKCEGADAVLKGAILERSDRRVRAEGEAADFGVASGGGYFSGGSGGGGFGAAVGGSGETFYSAEDRAQATVTLRLVNADGEVIWAHTQDSPGGKTKSALADAVERAVRQLLREVAKQEKQPDRVSP
ncbi:MAG TPA: hypothetical protein PLP42_08165 [Acidobacteriota bacterium]|nr:hypothetical protein [Acidobacteriota bacterium]